MRPRNSITVWGRTAELVVEVVRLVLILRHGSPQKCVVTGVMLCFMGQNVLRYISKNPRGGKSVCERFRKCLECCKVYQVKGKKKHRCYQSRCPNFQEVTDVNHDCYIQPMVEEKKKKQVKVSEVLEDEDLEADMTDQEDESNSTSLEALLCFMDTKCSLN